jgi:enterochelin esterase-like enzyme
MTEEKTTNLSSILVERSIILSQYLQREVLIDAYLPVNIPHPEEMNLLLINDGQDLPKMLFDEMLNELIESKTIQPIICIGIYCGEERKREYGTAYAADFKNRGDKAGLYTKFILDELLPFIYKTYNLYSIKEKYFAGFSLGGLSALDIVWNNAHEFYKAGIFSGSLWWRRKSYEEEYDDSVDRLMHLQITNGRYESHLKFFFECGALDETADRNNNGIIDSIDDTLDLIEELKKKGYTDESITYVELADGEHNVETWAKAFPDFLKCL